MPSSKYSIVASCDAFVNIDTCYTVIVVASVACAFKIANFVVARRVRFTIVGFISAFVVIGTVVINISSSNYDVASAIIVSTSSTGVVVVKTEKALVGIGANAAIVA